MSRRGYTTRYWHRPGMLNCHLPPTTTPAWHAKLPPTTYCSYSLTGGHRSKAKQVAATAIAPTANASRRQHVVNQPLAEPPRQRLLCHHLLLVAMPPTCYCYCCYCCYLSGERQRHRQWHSDCSARCQKGAVCGGSLLPLRPLKAFIRLYKA